MAHGEVPLPAVQWSLERKGQASEEREARDRQLHGGRGEDNRVRCAFPTQGDGLFHNRWFLKRRTQSSDMCHFSALVLFQNPIAQSMMRILTL
jgi:hypothetical protein